MRALALGSLLAVVACSRDGGRPPAAAAPGRDATTDGALATSNLEAMIEGDARVLSRDPARASTRLALVGLLEARAGTFGRIEDLDEALAVAEAGVRLTPRAPEAWLALAAARAGLHLFSAAAEDVATAERLGAEPDDVRAQRASLALATGRLAEAAGIARARVARQPDTARLSALAVVEAESGDEAAAARALDAALAAYRDTSPFPVAFVEFRRGLLAERAGRLDEAAAAYRRALARLPGHAQAAIHLATLMLATGTPAEAEAALSGVVPGATDPELDDVRARIALKQGRTEVAATLRARALARWDALVARHPEAFSDHAARAFLDGAPERAVPLALANFRRRPTSDALDLALTATSLAKDDAARCALVADAGRVERRTPRVDALLAASAPGCKARLGVR